MALESLQGQRDLIEACVQDLMFLSRKGRDPGVAFHNSVNFCVFQTVENT